MLELMASVSFTQVKATKECGSNFGKIVPLEQTIDHKATSQAHLSLTTTANGTKATSYV